MRRRRPDELFLSGADVESFVTLASEPLDFFRMLPMSFPPARAFISATSDLVRRYENPNAWIRELAFELEISSIRISGPAGALDDLDLELPYFDQPHGDLVRRTFAFEHTDEDGLPKYNLDDLYVVDTAGVDILFGYDASAEGQGRFALHRAAIDAAMSSFFGRRLDQSLAYEFSYTFTANGLAYDLDLAKHERYRSPIERGLGAEKRSGGLFSRIRRGNARPGSIIEPAANPLSVSVRTHIRRRDESGLYGVEDLAPLFADHRAQGGRVYRNVPFREHNYPYALLSADGEHLLPLVEVPGTASAPTMWRAGNSERLSREELVAALSVGRPISDES